MPVSRLLFFSLLFLLAGVTSANAAKWTQQMNIRYQDMPVGLLNFEIQKNPQSFTSKTVSESMPGGKMVEKPFRAVSNHEMTSDWVWLKSTIHNPVFSPSPLDVRVEPGRIIYETKTPQGIESREIPVSGAVLPRTAFYAYLVASAPREMMKEKEILVLDEDTMKLRKATWMFIGYEGRGSKRMSKFEIKGDLNLVFRVDANGRLRSIKDMDLGLFYEN